MKYQNITHDDMLNGEGIRVVLWVSGCEHHCPQCQNPCTWQHDDGIEFDGKAMKEIYSALDKSYIKGITFSGGDPLSTKNRNTILGVIAAVKLLYPNKDIWLYTGYTWEEILQDEILTNIIKNVDVLVDGRFNPKLADKNYKWAGSTNQRIINVQRTLEEGKIVIYESN